MSDKFSMIQNDGDAYDKLVGECRQLRQALAAEKAKLKEIDDFMRDGRGCFMEEGETTFARVFNAIVTRERERDALREENAELEKQIHDLCHDIHNQGPVTPDEFCKGCEAFQIKLFGYSPITHMREREERIRKVICESRADDKLFKYTVYYGGGYGPDVWDREENIEAEGILEAARYAAAIAKEAGGWVFCIEQNA